MGDTEVIDLAGSSSESETEAATDQAKRRRLRRPAAAEKTTAKRQRRQQPKKRVVVVEEDDESESDGDGSGDDQHESEDGGQEDEEEEEDFLTDDVESSSDEEEEVSSSSKRKRAVKAAPKGKKAGQGKPPPAHGKGRARKSNSEDDEEEEMVKSGMSQGSSGGGGGGKSIGVKRKRSEGKAAGAAVGARAGGVGGSSMLSFMRKESGPRGPTPVSTRPVAVEDKLWTDKYQPKRAVDLTVPPKKVEEVRRWLLDAMTGGRGAQKLLILRGAPGVGKSTMLEVLAKELSLKVISWAEVTGGAAWKAREDGESSWSGGGGRDYVSQAEDFQSFLRGSVFKPLEIDAKAGPAGGRARQIRFDDDDGGGGAADSRQLVVLEELPTQGTSDRAAGRLSAALSHFLAESRHPGVIVLTDENEDKGTLEYERRLPREVLQSPFVSQIRINPATDANVRKLLTRISSSERLPLSGDDLSAIVLSSRGDVRHAILTLQLHLAPLKRGKGSKSPGGGRAPPPSSAARPPSASSDKDAYYSSFHAIGKLLFAKRDASTPGPGSGDDRPPLSFVPETVMERCDMEADAIITFVQAHCVTHFTELSELADCLALLSDADLLISRIYSTHFHRDQRDPVYPEAYCSSMVGRAVAHTNRHPAKPTSSLKLTSPPWYECARTRRERLERLGHLCNDYALDMAANQVPPVRLSSEGMVQDLVPFAKAIAASTPPSGSSQPSQSSSSWSQRSAAEDEVESLTSALSFVRLFNRRLSSLGQQGSRHGYGNSSEKGLPAEELAEDDIVEDDV